MGTVKQNDFQSTKFKHLRYNPKKDVKNLFYGGYIAADCLPFDMTTQTKDLGIIVSNNECFGEQVEAVITKGKGCRDGYYLTDLQNPSKAPYDDTLQVSCAVGHGHGSVLLHGMVSRCIGTGEKAGVGSKVLYIQNKGYFPFGLLGKVKGSWIIFLGEEKREVCDNLYYENFERTST